MPQMTPSQARVIDPILTEVARGYGGNQSAVADVLFPIVPVAQRAGRVISFGADDFKLYTTTRAPGANTRRVQFGYASDTYALADYSLEGAVPVELMQEADAVPGIDLGANAVRSVRNIMSLEREKQAADLALNASNYGGSNKVTLSSNDRWDVYNHTDSNPYQDINTGKEAVRGQIGRRPNVLVVGPKVLSALRSHPKILDRLSTATDRPPATLAQLAALFELERVIEGGAVYHNGTAFVDVWGTYALLAYTTPASLAEMGSPNLGYTYQLNDYPIVEDPYFDRNTKSWYYPVTDARVPVLAGAAAGYLITTAVS